MIVVKYSNKNSSYEYKLLQVHKLGGVFMKKNSFLKYTLFFTGVLITINLGLIASFYTLLTRL